MLCQYWFWVWVVLSFLSSISGEPKYTVWIFPPLFFGRNFRPTEISVHHYYQYPEQKEYHSILRIRYRHKKGEQNTDNSFCATFQAPMLLDFVHSRLCFLRSWRINVMFENNVLEEFFQRKHLVKVSRVWRTSHNSKIVAKVVKTFLDTKGYFWP